KWHVAYITNTLTTVALFLLTNAAQNREHWLQRFYEIEKEAVRPRKQGELFAYIMLPPKTTRNQWAVEAILQRGGVEVHPVAPFTLGGKRYLADTLVVPVNQPYASVAKSLMESQHYTNLRNPDGAQSRARA